MFICKNPGDNGDWSCDGCIIWCFWCMQHSHPNEFQMMEKMSCIHLPSPENLARMYQMVQSVERTDGNWQHIISFQWICTLPAGYYWVSFNTCRFCTLIFLFCSLSNSPSQTPILLCRHRLVCDWSLAVLRGRVAEWLSQTEKRSKMEGDCLVM